MHGKPFYNWKASIPLLLLLSGAALQAQPFDLLIQGGHVIDPRNEVNAVMDVAIQEGKIARVAERISASDARTVVDARSLLVTPGLIDLHVHSDRLHTLDGYTFRTGVTTIVDAGGAGWRNFHDFKRQVIDRSRTRVLVFLSIVGSGLRRYFGEVLEEQDLADMDPKLTAMRIREFPETIVGVKTSHYIGPEWDPVERAVEAGRLADVPVMVDFGRFVPERPFEELVLKRLRPGDIYTHTYLDRVPMFDQNGKLRSYLLEARRRGVIFDAGHGGGSFTWGQAVPAIQQRFYPDSISTDLHPSSMNAGMKDLLNVMSKFLNLGMSIQEIILRVTWNPAQFIKRTDLGHLSEGAVADLILLRLRHGDFGFIDVRGEKKLGNRKLECELTIREGRVVWDLNGVSRPLWKGMVEQPHSGGPSR